MARNSSAGWRYRLMSVVCIILGTILALMIFATAYIETLLNRIDRPEDTLLSSEEIEQIIDDEALQATGTGPTINAEDIPMQEAPPELTQSQDIINIMLVGKDARPGQITSRSDAMILCTIDRSDNTVTMTSFLRDIYIQIPGQKNNKLNAAYAFGGMDLLSQTMTQNFGVKIDNTVAVDFSGFMEIIDMVGGVQISLTADEANYLNRRGNWEVTDESGWKLQPGPNLLTGSQALAYSRIRHIGSDFGRVERQKAVLTALAEKAKTMDLTQLNALVNQMVTLISTDMTNAEITGYVIDLFPMLKDLKIKTQTIPVKGTYSFSVIKGVGDSIIMDFDANLEILRQTLEQ